MILNMNMQIQSREVCTHCHSQSLSLFLPKTRLLYIFHFFKSNIYCTFLRTSTVERLHHEILACKFSPIPTKFIMLLRTPFAKFNFYEIIGTASEILLTLTCHINFFFVLYKSLHCVSRPSYTDLSVTKFLLSNDRTARSQREIKRIEERPSDTRMKNRDFHAGLD
jgi:hypothetical protein